MHYETQKVRVREWCISGCGCRRKWCLAGCGEELWHPLQIGQQCVRVHWSLAQSQRQEVSHYCWMALKEKTTLFPHNTSHCFTAPHALHTQAIILCVLYMQTEEYYEHVWLLSRQMGECAPRFTSYISAPCSCLNCSHHILDIIFNQLVGLLITALWYFCCQMFTSFLLTFVAESQQYDKWSQQSK